MRRLTGMLFPVLERVGIHVTPVGYYEPVPDTRRLRPSLWLGQSQLVGVRMEPDRQLELLDRFARMYRDEYARFPIKAPLAPGGFYLDNGFFGPVDAEILYCVVRDLAPKRIIEVGAGFSTLVIKLAAEANARRDQSTRIISIDPLPPPFVRELSGVELVEAAAEDVPLSRFGELESGDVLFIDSSHVLRIGGDVQYEYLELLPRLGAGVLIHVHDIFLPAEYPRPWVLEGRRFWSEQYLLQAFLAFNSQFDVLWASSMMHLSYPETLQSAISSYIPDEHLPGSFWIRRRT